MTLVVSRGFTLLEILVAIAIVTLIGMASSSVLTTVLDTDEISEQRFEQLQKLQRAIMFVERDLQQAVARSVRIEGESNQMVISGDSNAFESDADGLALVRAGWHNPQLVLPRSTLQAVAYRIQEEQLQRVYSDYVDNIVGYEPKVRVMLEGVQDLQFQFLVAEDQNTTWQDSFSGNQLPFAIAIEISTTEFGLIRREFALATTMLMVAEEV